MQIFVYIVVISFRFHTHTLVFTRIRIFSQTSHFFFQVLQNLLPIFAVLRFSPFSRIFFIIIVFYYGFILFQSNRICEKSEGKKFLFCSSQTSFFKRRRRRSKCVEKTQKFYCKNVMTIENAMVMVPNALVKIISEYVC